MTLSGVFHSMLSSARRSDAAQMPDNAEQAALRRCKVYRDSFPMTEIAFPADVLQGHPVVAKWARDSSLGVDVQTGEELAVAFAAGIHPSRMTIHADGMSESDLRAAAHFAPERVVVSSARQIELLATAVEHRTQGIFVRVIDENAPTLALTDGQYSLQDGFRLDSTELDRVVTAIVNNARLDLVGLYCDVGVLEHDFVSYPAAIGHIVTEMTDIRREHGVVLTRLGLGGGRTIPSGDWAVELRDLASQIDESLDDACATMRYPRPIVVLSPGRAITERHAA